MQFTPAMKELLHKTEEEINTSTKLTSAQKTQLKERLKEAASVFYESQDKTRRRQLRINFCTCCWRISKRCLKGYRSDTKQNE